MRVNAEDLMIMSHGCVQSHCKSVVTMIRRLISTCFLLCNKCEGYTPLGVDANRNKSTLSSEEGGYPQLHELGYLSLAVLYRSYSDCNVELPAMSAGTTRRRPWDMRGSPVAINALVVAA
jgi:hypothetical protein